MSLSPAGTGDQREAVSTLCPVALKMEVVNALEREREREPDRYLLSGAVYTESSQVQTESRLTVRCIFLPSYCQFMRNSAFCDQS